MTSPRMANDKVEETVNNQHNWNAIDDVIHYIIYCIPIALIEWFQEQLASSTIKTAEIIKRVPLKKGTKDQQEQKNQGTMPTEASVTGQSIKLGFIKQQKETPWMASW